MNINAPFELNNEELQRIQQIKSTYPNIRSTAMPLLYIAQEKLGSINESAINWVAKESTLAPVQVRELVTFYTMYHSKPVGKYHIQICRTLSCELSGSQELKTYIFNRIKAKAKQPSSDNFWSFEEVECLGSCGTAPVCQINAVFFENLTVTKLAELMDRIEKEKPDLSFSTLSDKLGAGLKGHLFSSNLVQINSN